MQSTPAVGRSDPESWLDVELPRFYAEHDEEPGAGEEALQVRIVDRDLLLADDGATLRALHAGIRVEEPGTSAQAAATYLAGSYAGGPASAVGYTLAVAGAALILDPDQVRWRVNLDGWPADTHFTAPPRILVPSGHPWQGRPGIEVEPDETVMIRSAVDAVVEFAAPIIDGCRALARVSKVGLWDEVADGLGTVLSYRLDVAATPQQLTRLGLASAPAGRPWKGRPRLGWATSPVLGERHIAQKGGCCLAFTCKHELTPYDELDADGRAHRDRFGVAPAGKRFCSTCRFRDADDVEARQLYWLERESAKRRQAG